MVMMVIVFINKTIAGYASVCLIHCVMTAAHSKLVLTNDRFFQVESQIHNALHNTSSRRAYVTAYKTTRDKGLNIARACRGLINQSFNMESQIPQGDTKP